jgi:DNA-binding transcriptional LysR family regulator
VANIIANLDLPLGVEIRHLAALEAIARTHSFSQAATQLGYAQSAVSQQIATLEKAVGHQLIERPGGPRPVSLTEAGEVLLRHATHITARLGAAKADLDALAAGEAGVLRVGTFQSASTRLLPPTLSRFRQDWPHVSIDLRQESPGVLLDDLVRNGQIDIAFADTSEVIEPFESVDLIQDPYVVMMAPDHPLANNEFVDYAELDDLAFIMASTEDKCTIEIESALRKAGSSPRLVFRGDDNLTTQRLVANGLGVAVIPMLAAEFGVIDALVKLIPVRPSTTRHIGIIWHRDRKRSKAAVAFMELAQQVAAAIALPSEPTLTAR